MSLENETTMTETFIDEQIAALDAKYETEHQLLRDQHAQEYDAAKKEWQPQINSYSIRSALRGWAAMEFNKVCDNIDYHYKHMHVDLDFAKLEELKPLMALKCKQDEANYRTHLDSLSADEFRQEMTNFMVNTKIAELKSTAHQQL
jgi:hypothetical protein